MVLTSFLAPVTPEGKSYSASISYLAGLLKSIFSRPFQDFIVIFTFVSSLRIAVNNLGSLAFTSSFLLPSVRDISGIFSTDFISFSVFLGSFAPPEEPPPNPPPTPPPKPEFPEFAGFSVSGFFSLISSFFFALSLWLSAIFFSVFSLTVFSALSVKSRFILPIFLQPLKLSPFTFVLLLLTVKSVRFLQLAKALLPMLFMLSGIIIFSKELQFSKALFSTFLIPFGNLMPCKFRQLENASLPMVLTVEGMITFSIPILP